MIDADSTEALRSRLATENLLAQKQRELATANQQIAKRALVLSEEVIERRHEAQAALSEAEKIKSKHQEAITHLRKAKSETMIAERRLWASLETMGDGFAIFDRSACVVAANAAFFAPYEDIECVRLGVSFDELVQIGVEEGIVDPGDMDPQAWIDWMKSRWEANSITPTTVRFWNNQFVQLTGRRTPDGDVVIMGTNITRQIRRQRVLEQARKRAEAANRAKSAFLANMSHEIRTPMNGVLAMADMLAEEDLSEDQKLCLETIKSSGEALLVIINDVLDYSKIEAQKLTIEYAPFDLEASIQEVVTLLQPTAREKDLSLIVDYDIFLPTRFNGDKGRIRQILMNLVGNAVKFTPEGHVIIRVVGLADSQPGHFRLHITVEDTGIGISPEQRQHIFGEFNQVQSEMNRQFDGTGLGLAITQRLVHLMDGDIWVDEGAEAGSVFGFRLTLKSEGPTGEGLRGSFGNRRILLCDPDPASADVISKQMLGLGLRPQVVGSPDDPLITGADHDDLVILVTDHGMQGAIRLTRGAPGDDDDGRILHRPVLRQPLLATLTEILEATEETRKPSTYLEEPPSEDQPVAAVLESHESPAIKENADPEEPGEPAVEMDNLIDFVAPPVVEKEETSDLEARPTAEQDAAPAVAASEEEAGPEDAAIEETVTTVFASSRSSLPEDEPRTASVAVPETIETPEMDLQSLDVGEPVLTPEAPLVEESPRTDQAPTPPETEAPPSSRRKVRVLAAEDNKTNQLVLKRLLKTLDIDLEIVENGMLAVERYKEAQPDLILTDISMPVMDGKAATREIRAFERAENLPKVPIVAMTAHAVAGDEQDILSAGVDFYMTKPLRKDALIQHVLAATPEDAHPPIP